jgi:hypothetical protein
MQWFGTTDTRKFNTRNFKKGHLFQGRYKSILVQNDAYVMQLSCYIHRNPLRAGIVRRLIDYKWSSYPIYAYAKKGPAWLSTEGILPYFKGADKHKCDLLVYLLWNKGLMSNEQLGRHFNISYSAVSQIVKIFKEKMLSR